MVLLTKNGRLSTDLSNKRWLVGSTSLGILMICVPIVFIFFDPLLIISLYRLRVDNGTLIHNLLTQKLDGPKIYLYLFNITNGDRFISGEDDKIKLEEVGPFVYQEYRTIDDLEINQEPGIMRYTPHLWAEFVPEESFGDPKEVYLTLPHIPLLMTTAQLSKYPSFIRNLFNMLSSSLKSKVLIKTRVYDYLWAYSDPLINIANKLIPGFIYFNTTGLLERFFDADAEYRYELGTTSEDKFQVKTVTKFSIKNGTTSNIMTQVQTYEDAYEGAIFPPRMNPEKTFNLYRHSICKTFKFAFKGTRKMEHGSDAFVYDFHNSTLNEHKLCDGKGWCPDGIYDISPCFASFPFAISKGHFLDSDPKLFEKIEGLKPNRSIHKSEILVDPKLGVTLSAKISAQMSLTLGDLSYKKETKRFSNMFLPVVHAILKHPPMTEEAKRSLLLLYYYGPYILLACQVICSALGVLILIYSFRTIYLHRKIVRRHIIYETTVLEPKLSVKSDKSDSPLIQNLNNSRQN